MIKDVNCSRKLNVLLNDVLLCIFLQGHYLLAVSLDNLQFYGLAISAFLNALHYDVNHRDRLADNVAVVAANLCNFPEETLQKFVGEYRCFQAQSIHGCCMEL